MTKNLLDDLKKAATQSSTPPPAPPRWAPGVIYQGRMPSEITTPPLPELHNEAEYEEAIKALGFPLPAGHTLALVEAQYVYHENFWTREKQGEDALTKPSSSWRYRFKVIPKSFVHDDDFAALVKQSKEAARTHVPITYGGPRTKVISFADLQLGKVDELGGTPETLLRTEFALLQICSDIQNGDYSEVILADVGDLMEGFESSPNADRTNDLSLTQQIRLGRRILWRWIEVLSPLVPSLKTVGVPSNHCRVRRGKNVMGDALDDYGIDIIASLSDIAAANPAAYGHVEFIVPENHHEHVLLASTAGPLLGFTHGHQKSSPDQVPNWIKSTGRRGLAQADIVVVGHFHHLRVIAFGDGQTLFVSPTNDNGSSWFTPGSGERSRPGVLTFDVEADGWTNMKVIWTA